MMPECCEIEWSWACEEAAAQNQNCVCACYFKGPAYCDDGDLCNGIESCTWPGGDCLPGGVQCDDGWRCLTDPCITEVCGFDPYCCDTYWDSICGGYACAEPLCDRGCPCDSPQTCESWSCDGDANGDAVVDPLDAGFILARFGLDPCIEGCASDVNCDGFIDPLDSGYAQARFGTCDEPPALCEVDCD